MVTAEKRAEIDQRLKRFSVGRRIALSDAPTPSTRAWPAPFLPLKLLAKAGDRGAGDIIARTIGPIGGDAFKILYKKIFGKDCGCGGAGQAPGRQEALNARWPLSKVGSEK